MYERWLKAYCSLCSTANWLLESESDDLSTSEIDAFKCWKCRRAVSLFDDEDPGEVSEVGQKKPG